MQAFAPTIRTLLCPHCGAPIDVPPGGGLVQCRYCAVTNEIVPRPALRQHENTLRARRTRAIEAAVSLTALETSRLCPEMPPLVWPPAVGPQLVGRAPADKIAIVRDAWLECFRTLHSSYSAELDRRLYVLTMGLQSVALQLNELRCVRGALESALEETRIDAQRQTLLAQLALDAAIAGDPDAARTWLAQIDSRLLGIEEVETGVRVARACIALRAGDHERVIALLGHKHGNVTVAPYGELLSRLLRVEALHSLGHDETAGNEYYHALIAFGPKCAVRVRRAYGLAGAVARRGRMSGWTTVLLMAAAGGALSLVSADRVGVRLPIAIGLGAIVAAAIILVFIAFARVRKPSCSPPIGYE